MTRLLDDDDSDWCGFSFSYFFFIWQRSCTINNRAATVAAAGSLGAGLSVSHDSVFGLDISPESDAYFTHHRNQPAAESLPSSASFQYMVTSIFFFFEIRVLDVEIIKFIIERVESSYWWKTSLGRRWWRSTSFARQCDADDGPGPCGLFIGMCQVPRSSDRWLCRHFPFWKCKKRFFSLIKKYPSIRYLSFCYSKKDWQTHLLENIPQNLCVF